MLRDRRARIRFSVSAPSMVALLGLSSAGCLGEPADPALSYYMDQLESTECGILWSVQYRTGSTVVSTLPAALSLDLYPLGADGLIVSPTGSQCNREIRDRLQALCEDCRLTPSRCETEVRALFALPPPSCSVCGDEVCYLGENEDNCARDCAARCGDGLCSAVESGLTCPQDCAEPCGDGFCSSEESPDDCPEDCRFTVGDGRCDPGENLANSPADCRSLACGDRWCQPWETSLLCPQDCCGSTLCTDGAAFCVDSATLSRCEATGLGNCPELITSEVCEIGCRHDVGESARCLTCDDVFAELGRIEPPVGCEDTGPPQCTPDRDGVVTCEPLAAFPMCRETVVRACQGRSRCAVGGCRACLDEPCTVGQTRCGGTNTVEVCDTLGTCRFWVPRAECGTESTCVEADGAASCVR